MNYYHCHFEIKEPQPWSEILVTYLAEINFESFELILADVGVLKALKICIKLVNFFPKGNSLLRFNMFVKGILTGLFQVQNFFKVSIEFFTLFYFCLIGRKTQAFTL